MPAITVGRHRSGTLSRRPAGLWRRPRPLPLPGPGSGWQPRAPSLAHHSGGGRGGAFSAAGLRGNPGPRQPRGTDPGADAAASIGPARRTARGRADAISRNLTRSTGRNTAGRPSFRQAEVSPRGL